METVQAIVQSPIFQMIAGLCTIIGFVIVLIKSRGFRLYAYKYFLWPIWVTKSITCLSAQANNNLPPKRHIDYLIDKTKLEMDLGMLWYLGKDKDMGPYCQTCYTSNNILQLLDVRLGTFGKEQQYRTYCRSHKESEQLIAKERYDGVYKKIEVLKNK
jgi:hypothetical protein